MRADKVFFFCPRRENQVFGQVCVTNRTTILHNWELYGSDLMLIEFC